MLREIVKVSLTFSNGVGRLNSAGGGESPAGAALALVLNGDNVSSRNPVDRGGSVGNAVDVVNVRGEILRRGLVTK